MKPGSKINTIYEKHFAVKRSSYEAMFGSKPKITLKTSNIPLRAMDTVATEEDLKDVVKPTHIEDAQIEILQSQKPTTSEDILSGNDQDLDQETSSVCQTRCGASINQLVRL